MSDEATSDTKLVELCKAGDEFEARMIVALLADHGIEATTTGEFTAGFRAEAPGVVRVFVNASDGAKAQEALKKSRTTPLPSEPSDELSENKRLSQVFKITATIIVAILLGFFGTHAFAVLVEFFRTTPGR